MESPRWESMTAVEVELVSALVVQPLADANGSIEIPLCSHSPNASPGGFREFRDHVITEAFEHVAYMLRSDTFRTCGSLLQVL